MDDAEHHLRHENRSEGLKTALFGVSLVCILSVAPRARGRVHSPWRGLGCGIEGHGLGESRAWLLLCLAAFRNPSFCRLMHNYSA